MPSLHWWCLEKFSFSCLVHKVNMKYFWAELTWTDGRTDGRRTRLEFFYFCCRLALDLLSSISTRRSLWYNCCWTKEKYLDGNYCWTIVALAELFVELGHFSMLLCGRVKPSSSIWMEDEEIFLSIDSSKSFAHFTFFILQSCIIHRANVEVLYYTYYYTNIQLSHVRNTFVDFSSSSIIQPVERSISWTGYTYIPVYPYT